MHGEQQGDPPATSSGEKKEEETSRQRRGLQTDTKERRGSRSAYLPTDGAELLGHEPRSAFPTRHDVRQVLPQLDLGDPLELLQVGLTDPTAFTARAATFGRQLRSLLHLHLACHEVTCAGLPDSGGCYWAGGILFQLLRVLLPLFFFLHHDLHALDAALLLLVGEVVRHRGGQTAMCTRALSSCSPARSLTSSSRRPLVSCTSDNASRGAAGWMGPAEGNGTRVTPRQSWTFPFTYPTLETFPPKPHLDLRPSRSSRPPAPRLDAPGPCLLAPSSSSVRALHRSGPT